MPTAFGNVPHPPFIDRLIPDIQNRAWDDLGQRRPVGVCQHSMLGSLWGTDEYFRRGSASRALTDYGIGGSTDGPQWDGVILRWNDPRGAAATVTIDGNARSVSPNRAPWANGGSDGLEGDGPAFVRRLGVAAINRDLVSIERSDGGVESTPMSPRQFESICSLTAYWFDVARVPWTAFPLNPDVGVVTHLLHSEFSTKACPFAPVAGRIEEIQQRVRQILRAAQEMTSPPAATTPPPLTDLPDAPWWPQGYDLPRLQVRFGILEKVDINGTRLEARFDPKGVISNAWMARGVAEQRTADELPAARMWWVLQEDETRRCDLVTFDDRWTLFRPDPNVTWTWIA